MLDKIKNSGIINPIYARRFPRLLLPILGCPSLFFVGLIMLSKGECVDIGLQ
jgi:hypothetical protein